MGGWVGLLMFAMTLTVFMVESLHNGLTAATPVLGGLAFVVAAMARAAGKRPRALVQESEDERFLDAMLDRYRVFQEVEKP